MATLTPAQRECLEVAEASGTVRRAEGAFSRHSGEKTNLFDRRTVNSLHKKRFLAPAEGYSQFSITDRGRKAHARSKKTRRQGA